MNTRRRLANDAEVLQRVLDHVDAGTTDLGDSVWREPVEHYRSADRLAAELGIFRRSPTPFCPSAALPGAGSYVARDAAGTPLLAVRDRDGRARVFRNACRHRGTALADGTGCGKAFVCRYHGWTYGLDGALRHVPHERGFPGLDKDERGLVAVPAVETHGLVFVTQEGTQRAPEALEGLESLIPARYRLVGGYELELPVNWKILVEGFLEGYHIRPTHAGTFYPVQYDNLNVVETFGPNARIVFPYRAVEKQRSRPPAERSVERALTYVYHLFPNVMVATFPGRVFLVAHEPLATDRTRQVTYLLTDKDENDAEAQVSLARGSNFVDAGAAEDREVAFAIQRSLGSGANEHFEFGLFESLIVHFHRTLTAALAREAELRGGPAEKSA